MLRSSLDTLPASRIREVANAALGSAYETDLVKFWFGEGDLPTPAFIREAAKAALDAGDTFYNHNLGRSRAMPPPCTARRSAPSAWR
jgi:aspartate/methionine/tyrosine aminotransferase